MANAASNQSIQTFETGIKTVERIEAASKGNGLETRLSLQRWASEEISRGFTAVFPVPHLVKGGLIHNQISRETGDLDITFPRKVTEDELRRALKLMEPLLVKKGLEIVKVRKATELVINGDGGIRLPIELKAGTTRINVHTDATGGMQHLPAIKKDGNGKRIQVPASYGGVFFKDQEPLLAFYQPLEAQAADKIAAIVLRPDTTRLKDFADIYRLGKMNLSPTMIAVELSHKLSFMFEKPYEVIDALPEVPTMMSFDYMREKSMQWQMWQERNARNVPADFTDVCCDIRQLYARVRELVVMSLNVERRPRITRNPTVAKIKVLGGRTNNVYHMGDYRDPETLAYRPKF